MSEYKDEIWNRTCCRRRLLPASGKFTSPSKKLAKLISLMHQQGAEAKVYTTWAQKRVDDVKYRLERVLGKGLVGLYNEKGQVEIDRLGWAKTAPVPGPLG